MSTRDFDIAFFTAISAGIFGFGLWLFAADMRTAGAPADHIFIADAITLLLTATTVVAGVLALIIRRQSKHGVEQ